MENTAVEKWQQYIAKLGEIVKALGLNWNQMEKDTKLNRGNLKKIFEFETCPSLEIYLKLADYLEEKYKAAPEEIKALHNPEFLVFTHLTTGQPGPAMGVDLAEGKDTSVITYPCGCTRINGVFGRNKECMLNLTDHVE